MNEALVVLQEVFTSPMTGVWILVGTALGITVGAMPGLPGAMLIALTLPLTYGMQPEAAARAWLKDNPQAVEPWLEGVTTADGGDAMETAAKAASALAAGPAPASRCGGCCQRFAVQLPTPFFPAPYHIML